MKQWIRQKKLSRLSVDSNDPTMRCPTAEPETEGLMASAEECYLAWRSHFETEEWREHAVAFKAAVTAIYFLWAGEGAIVRPATDVQFDTLVGISSSYQYFMLREGEVLMRPHSCWCPACFDVAVAGPGAGTRLPTDYVVVRCAKAGNPFYEWCNASCRAKTGADAGSPDLRARTHGRSIAAAGLEPGQWVLVEAFGDDEDEMWLGKTLAFGHFGQDSCCKRHGGGTKKLYGTAFNTGDYMVAVQWYERLSESGDGERREFVRGERMINVINSTLRMAGLVMKAIGVFHPAAAAAANDSNIDTRSQFELPRRVEAEAPALCRLLFQLAILTPPKGASPQTLVGTGPAGAEPREAASERTHTHEGYVWC